MLSQILRPLGTRALLDSSETGEMMHTDFFGLQEIPEIYVLRPSNN